MFGVWNSLILKRVERNAREIMTQKKKKAPTQITDAALIDKLNALNTSDADAGAASQVVDDAALLDKLNTLLEAIESSEVAYRDEQASLLRALAACVDSLDALLLDKLVARNTTDADVDAAGEVC